MIIRHRAKKSSPFENFLTRARLFQPPPFLNQTLIDLLRAPNGILSLPLQILPTGADRMDKKLLKSILLIITYAVLLVLFISIQRGTQPVLDCAGPVPAPVHRLAIALVLQPALSALLPALRPGTGQDKGQKPLQAFGRAHLLPSPVRAHHRLFLPGAPKLVDSIQLFLSSINGYMLNVQKWLNDQEWLSPSSPPSIWRI